MSALEKVKPAEVAAPQSETVALLNVIERMVKDPSVDVVKVEKLFDLQERILARNAEVAYNAALAEMQPKLPAAAHRGLNTNTQKSYAKWEDIHAAISPVLAEYGFALSFKTEVNEKVAVTAILRHRDGHSDQTSLALPVDTGAGRNAVQSVGSSVSYGKRYTACALLNIRTNEDDDGHGSGGLINESQVNVFKGLVETHKANASKLLQYVGAASVEEMTQSQLDNATEALLRWAETQKKQADKKAAK